MGNTPLVEFTFITTENNEIWESGKSSLGLLLMSCASASIRNIALNIKFFKTFESSVLRRKQKSTTQWDHISRLSCKSHASWSTSHFNCNHKNYNFLACDCFKNVLFSTNSLAKLLSDSLLLDSLLLDSLLSDSLISQSHSKM